MDQSLERPDHVGRRAGLGRLVVAHLEVAAHAGGEVDHHVGVAAADAVDDFAVELHIAAALAGLGVAHMEWAMAAPAFAASIAASAICLGVTGTCRSCPRYRRRR